MTPRALFTAIGSTAIAFAIAIGIAAGSASSQSSVGAASAHTTISTQSDVALLSMQANQDCPLEV